MKQVVACRFLGLGGLTLFLVSAFTPLPNLLDQWISTSPRIEPAGAIVVLAGGLDGPGVLNESSLRRALHGIALYRKGYAPFLVFLGGPPDGRLAEAGLRAEFARELGIPPEAILTDAGGRTTREEAARVNSLLRPRGIRRIVLVTDARHMARARGVFERAEFEVLVAPSGGHSGALHAEDRVKLMRSVLLELCAWVYYRLFGYL